MNRLANGQLFTVCVLVWGTTWYAITWQIADLAPEIGVALRFALAGATVLGFAAWRGMPLRFAARDHARFGLMFLNGGMANGKQVVPADWVRQATVPDEGYEPVAPGEPIGYQYQWWTFAGSDAYAAMGLHHQFIYVDPTNDMVIVKITHTPEPVGRDEENLALFAQIAERLSK